jgi:translation factor GUF1, mitochondrial
MDFKRLSGFSIDKIRNFSVIAHVDHGKSTLCDRMLEKTGTLHDRVRHEQFLDKLQVEKERGITVKAQSASMIYEYKSEKYLLNLIDTPGHVDFSYEVSKSLEACQGVILLVDATQGVQAQTMANFYHAFSKNLKIIPVINKIDVASADIERTMLELKALFDFEEKDCLLVSGKTGVGIDDLFKNIIDRLPAPPGSADFSPKALLFDSWFDEYKGVISLIYVKDGSFKKGDKIIMHHIGEEYEILEIGVMYPDQASIGALFTGQVGYIICGMKTVKEAFIGDTMYLKKFPVVPFDSFKQPKPFVFAGIFPVDTSDFEGLRDAVEKLTLNDSSVRIEKANSTALGIGFKCGFLGLLHMEVFQQRLEQEYGMPVIITSPSVLYKVELKDSSNVLIETPSDFPDQSKIEKIFEPIIKATILLNKEHIGAVMELCQKRRGKQLDLSYIGETRLMLVYELPLNEIAIDFYDKLKSITSGYASLDYEEFGYSESDLVKMDILLNGSSVDALSMIVHSDSSYYVGRDIVDRLRKIISRQMFEVAIQAAVGSKVLARASVSAFRKDVTSHCYGGDITRKKKLLEKQKEGKKKMKQIGNIKVPKEAFLVLLNRFKN